MAVRFMTINYPETRNLVIDPILRSHGVEKPPELGIPLLLLYESRCWHSDPGRNPSLGMSDTGRFPRSEKMLSALLASRTVWNSMLTANLVDLPFPGTTRNPSFGSSESCDTTLYSRPLRWV